MSKRLNPKPVLWLLFGLRKGMSLFLQRCGFGGKVSWRRLWEVTGNSKWSHFSISQWEHLNGFTKEGTLPVLTRACKDGKGLDTHDKESNRSTVSTFSPSEHFSNLNELLKVPDIILSFSFSSLQPKMRKKQSKGKQVVSSSEDRACLGQAYTEKRPLLMWSANRAGEAVFGLADSLAVW